jgi:hypothetical protein
MLCHIGQTLWFPLFRVSYYGEHIRSIIERIDELREEKARLEEAIAQLKS